MIVRCFILLLIVVFGKTVEEFREEFNKIDLNQDGYIDAHELRMTYKTDDESLITFMFENFDGDRDGVINFEEMYSRSE